MELQAHLFIRASATPPLQPLELQVHGAPKSRENTQGQKFAEFWLRTKPQQLLTPPSTVSAQGMQDLHTRNYSQLQLLDIHNKCLMAKIVCCGQCHLSCHMGTIVYSPLWLGYVILTSSGAVVLDQGLLSLSSLFRPLLILSLYQVTVFYHCGYTRTEQLPLCLTAREKV